MHLDFETANSTGVDLTRVGAYVYAAHPETRILCMAYAFADEEPLLWWPDEPFPEAIKDHVMAGGDFYAFNAQFEQLIWSHCLPRSVPSPSPMQWYCVAAQARVNGLPGKLERAAQALGLPLEKDDAGRRLMLKLTRGTPPKPGELQRLGEYCQQDVRVERAVHQACRPLTADDRYVYYLNEMINLRGVQVDREFVRQALVYLEHANDELNAELADVTGGAVTAITQVPSLKAWLATQGYEVDTLDKRRVDVTWFEGAARRAIEIRQLGAKSSAAKYATLERQTSSDDRIRGMFLFAGAGQTGRFSSLGVQLHNLLRDVLPDAEKRIAAIKRLSPAQYTLIYNEPIIHTMSQLIRPTLVAASGHILTVGDSKSIEAMMTPYLAGCEEEMQVWRDPDGDRYIDDAAAIYYCAREDVTKAMRQEGKVVRLSLQFCGGPGALMAMAEGYGMDFSEQQAVATVEAWRAANEWVADFGRAMERAAMKAVRNPGQAVDVGEHITYGAEQVNGQMILRCLLPSGRVISYHDVQWGKNRYGQACLTSIKPRTGQREDLWRGIFVENAVQATCNDLQRHAMALAAGENLPVVAHVHDELVIETKPRDGLVEQVKRMMEDRPAWCPDFPLVADVSQTGRYTK
jgi:DNA polymerase